MKKISLLLLVATFIIASSDLMAQKVQTVKLKQVPGKFTKTTLKLKPGVYQFEIKNSGVDHEVGFVVAPKGAEEDAEQHLSDAYLTKTIVDGETGKSNAVTLEEGTYSYFCPLNPTPLYTLVVESDD